MRCTILLTSFLLIIVCIMSSCTSNDEMDMLIYERFDFAGKSLGDKDTLYLQKLNDHTLNATFLKEGKEISFSLIMGNTFVKVISKDSSTILYDVNSKEIHNNILDENYSSPFFAKNTKYSSSQSYKLSNRVFYVHFFRTELNTSYNNLMYYSPKYGFICFLDEGTGYKRLSYSSNLSKSDKNLLNNLIDTVIKDSSAFNTYFE
ncbi:MAG: hypothetical protein V1720_17150 [bacterium]